MALDLGGSDASPSAPPKVRKLQKLNLSPYAAWSFEQKNGNQRTDRSGNGRHAGGNLFTYGADIASPVPGKSANSYNGLSSQAAAPQNAPDCSSDHFMATGYTFTGWVLCSGVPQNGYSEQWGFGWTTDYSSVLPFYANNATRRLMSWCNGAAAVSDFYLELGRWHWFSVSCEPAGAGADVEWGLDDAYQLFPDVGLAAPAFTSTLSFGAGNYTTNYGRQWMGALFDVVLWDRVLTRAEKKKQLASTL